MESKDFASLIRQAGKAKRTGEFKCPYIKDFFVEITYASKMILNQIRDVAKEISGNPRTGQREERLNEDKLRNEYARQIIRSWRGLTPEKLVNMLPGVEYSEEDKDKDITFSADTAIAMLEVSLEFEAWIIDIATEVSNFKHVAEEQEKEEENL